MLRDQIQVLFLSRIDQAFVLNLSSYLVALQKSILKMYWPKLMSHILFLMHQGWQIEGWNLALVCTFGILDCAFSSKSSPDLEHPADSPNLVVKHLSSFP